MRATIRIVVERHDTSGSPETAERFAAEFQRAREAGFFTGEITAVEHLNEPLYSPEWYRDNGLRA